MVKVREDRRRKAPGTHMTEEIKVRVCVADHEELIAASKLSHGENLTGYVRDCMFIGHRLQQGGQEAQILAAVLLRSAVSSLPPISLATRWPPWPSSPWALVSGN